MIRLLKVLAVLAVGVALALPTGAARADTLFTDVYSTVLNGDFVTGGATSRVDTFGTPQTEPFSISLSGIPAGSTIVKAFASWNWLSGLNPTTENTISINGNSVTGALVGSGADLCWGLPQGISYLADVTSLISGNGSYTIAGATDKNGSLGEGVQLLAVYSNPSSPLQQINVAAGYMEQGNGPGPADATITFAMGPYLGGPTHYFQNALDGQDNAGDTFKINGTDVSGVFPGTFASGDAWAGLRGPGATNNLYDFAEGNSAPYMAVGDTSITGHTDSLGDCIGHTFGAIAMSAIPEPASMTLLGMGLVCAVGYRGLRRKK
jgi:hypothetical protein